MADYKHTLNLPTTEFPMKAALAEREPLMLKHWKDMYLYDKIREKHAGNAKFVLHDGPPYANGHLHCGHALNKILKDVIVKAKTLHGMDAPFLPGWDCHGLPIELNVEKEVLKKGESLSPKEFRARCRAYAHSQIEIQKDEFQRLGIFGDWEHPYTTMDQSYEAAIIRTLAEMMRHGYLTQGFKPVHWCMDCHSALAEAEVEYENKTSTALDVAFYVENNTHIGQLFQIALHSKPIIVPIWTTTAWTLPANEAVCLHPELDYDLVETEKAYYILAHDLHSAAMERYKIADYTISGSVKGAQLEHQLVRHPWIENKMVPIVLGHHVTCESGTGCVHTAPAHGMEDYLIGLHYRLAWNSPVMGNGCFQKDIPALGGLHIWKAQEPILALLRYNHTLIHAEPLTHSYPHCWRHKTPLIFLATPQWFVSIDAHGLRERIQDAIQTVTWIPAWGSSRMWNMFKDRSDWCISRQRMWGTPIPIFIHKETKKPHPKTLDYMTQVADMVEKEGIEAWFDLDPKILLGDEAKDYDKTIDTLDVWFEAGISHHSILKKRKELTYPADLYLEGSDQYRGWFNSSLTTGVALDDIAPYKGVLTHGYTVDSEGKKLSKSRGNYVALDKLIAQYGADVLRLWIASSDYRNEVSISPEIMTRVVDTYRRIRNTCRFLLANIWDFEPSKHHMASQDWVALDAWMIKRCQIVQEEIVHAYTYYQFHVVYQKIHHFCAIELGSFYCDVIKDRQYTCSKDSLARRSCQHAMYHILCALTRWLAPVLSFTAEEIAGYIPEYAEASIFLTTWYTAWPNMSGTRTCDWEKLQMLRDEVNKALEIARQAGRIGSALAAQVSLYVDKTWLDILEPLESELRFLCITSGVSLAGYEACPKDAYTNESLRLGITVYSDEAPKCERCWHRAETVGSDKAHPTLCTRCVNNITGKDEIRKWI